MFERSEKRCGNCKSRMLSFETKCYVCGKEWVEKKVQVRDRLRVTHLRSEANFHLSIGFLTVLVTGVITLVLHWIGWMSFFPYLVTVGSMVYGTYQIFLGLQISSRLMRALALIGYGSILFFSYWIVFSGGEETLPDFGVVNFKNSLELRLDQWGNVYPEGCLESEFHFPVDCDSELAAFEIVNSVEVINASHYPYKSDWQKYAERCPDESDSFSYPSLSEWKMGDNQLLCLTSINLKNGYEESHHHD